MGVDSVKVKISEYTVVVRSQVGGAEMEAERFSIGGGQDRVSVAYIGTNGPAGLQGAPGAAGAAGAPGPQGPPGEDGLSDAHYVHNQIAASNHWVVVHNLGKRPAIVVKDTAGTEMVGNRTDPDLNTTILDWSASFSGTVDCN